MIFMRTGKNFRVGGVPTSIGGIERGLGGLALSKPFGKKG